MQGLAIFQYYYSEYPTFQFWHGAPITNAAIRLNRSRQWFSDNAFAPFLPNVWTLS